MGLLNICVILLVTKYACPSDASDEVNIIKRETHHHHQNDNSRRMIDFKKLSEVDTILFATNAVVGDLDTTAIPTFIPTNAPTDEMLPTSIPTISPTSIPSSSFPTTTPTRNPSSYPTIIPSVKPTGFPTGVPTNIPSNQPTSLPSTFPTSQPSTRPTSRPTSLPTSPSGQPTSSPTDIPTSCPSGVPSTQPNGCPTSQPTLIPSSFPSEQPTSQPTLSPASPTTQPTSSPSAQPTSLPTSSPTESQPINVDWGFTPNFDGDMNIGLAFSVTVLGIAVVLSIGSIYLVGLRGSREFREQVGLLSNFLLNIFIYILMCRRFDFFLTSDSYFYHTTADGNSIWPGPEYDSAHIPTLLNAGCPVAYDPYTNDLAELQQSNDKCYFLGFPLPKEIIQDGMVKFSIGLGLMIYFVFMLLAMVVTEIMKRGNLDQIPWWIRPILRLAFKYIVEVFITSQQFCVLMLLTNVNANQYCAYFVTPASAEYSLCLYEYGVHALPWGIIFGLCAIGGYFVCKFLQHMVDESKTDNERLFWQLLLLVAVLSELYCIFMSIAFFVYWLFAGFVIGVWYAFAEFAFTVAYVISQISGTAIYVINDMVEFIFDPDFTHPSAVAIDADDPHPAYPVNPPGPMNQDDLRSIAINNTPHIVHGAIDIAIDEMEERERERKRVEMI